jgi:hypothetical protein
MNNKKFLFMIFFLCITLVGCGFVGSPGGVGTDVPGFLMGIWHGLLAPWTLIARFFLNIEMYAVPNTGFTYDLGFILGITASIPIGWLAALIAVAAHLYL